MKNLLCWSWIWVALLASPIQVVAAPILSPQAEIRLLTCAPGDELYSSFGHTALWIYDPATATDRVYNYGVFNFNTEGFYIKFARGKLKYELAVTSYERFARGYQYEQREVISQVINFNPEFRQRLYDLLEENYKPENRQYLYDFFFDNCSSRIRDMFKKAAGDQLRWPSEVGKGEETFRELIQPYIEVSPWADFGIDLGLGLPADQVASPEDYMFLPDYLSEGVAKASLGKGDLAQPATVVVLPAGQPDMSHGPLTPHLLCWLLFALTAVHTMLQLRKGNLHFSYDKFLFFFAGLAGWVVFLLWVATDHDATQWNLNVLWLVPLYLPLAFWMKKDAKPAIRWFFRVCGILLLIQLVMFPVWPQAYHTAFIPIMLSLLLRLGYWEYWERKLRG